MDFLLKKYQIDNCNISLKRAYYFLEVLQHMYIPKNFRYIFWKLSFISNLRPFCYRKSVINKLWLLDGHKIVSLWNQLFRKHFKDVRTNWNYVYSNEIAFIILKLLCFRLLYFSAIYWVLKLTVDNLQIWQQDVQKLNCISRLYPW